MKFRRVWTTAAALALLVLGMQIRDVLPNAADRAGRLGLLRVQYAGSGLVTVLCRSPISLCHLGFEGERANAAQI